jgi:hypothetical protein
LKNSSENKLRNFTTVVRVRDCIENSIKSNKFEINFLRQLQPKILLQCNRNTHTCAEKRKKVSVPKKYKDFFAPNLHSIDFSQIQVNSEGLKSQSTVRDKLCRPKAQEEEEI